MQNYGNQSYGNITLKQATAYSSNTGYIQVAEAIGNDKIMSLVKKLGIDPAKDNIEDVPVMTLGTVHLTARDGICLRNVCQRWLLPSAHRHYRDRLAYRLGSVPAH